MLARDFLRCRLRLAVEESALGREPHEGESPHLVLKLSPLGFGEEFIELLDVPPAVHVRLAQAKLAVAQRALVESLVVHLEVPRVGAIQLDVSQGKDFAYFLFRGLRQSGAPNTQSKCCDPRFLQEEWRKYNGEKKERRVPMLEQVHDCSIPRDCCQVGLG